MHTSNVILPPQLMLSKSVVYASQGNIYALNSNDGRVKQSYSISGSNYAAIINDVIYANVSQESNWFVQALRLNDGDFLWSYRIEGRPVQSPVIVDEVVYVSITEGSIYALQARDGTLLWRSAIDFVSDKPSYLDPIIFTSPVVIRDMVYLIATINSPLNSFLYAFNARDGFSQWWVQIPDVNSFLFSVTEEAFYFIAVDG